MNFTYFAYILKPPVVEGNKAQTTFYKVMVSSVAFVAGDIVMTDKNYLVDSIVHTPSGTCVLLLEASLGFQFNPAPHLLDKNNLLTKIL
jgi:hypothetical protein